MNKSQVFCYFDNFGFDMHQVYWLDGAKIYAEFHSILGSNATYREMMPTETAIPSLSTFPTFRQIWSEICDQLVVKLPAGQLVLVDLEHIPHQYPNGAKDYQYLRQLVERFQLKAPGAKICVDGISPPMNREDVKAKTVRMDADVYGVDPDFVTIGAYLLGAQYVERDFTYISNMRTIMRRAYPKARLMFSVWGRYHNAWPQPNNGAIEPEILEKYANLVTRYGDDVIVFEPEKPRDQWFVDCIYRRSEV